MDPIWHGLCAMSQSTEPPVWELLDKWIAQGLGLRDRLIAERRRLIARIQHIDIALAAIPREAPATAPKKGGSDDGPPMVSIQPGGRLSAIAAVRMVLERFPGGLTTGELTREVAKFQPIPAKLIAHAVHQLYRQRGEVEKVGDRETGKSKRVYALKKDKPRLRLRIRKRSEAVA